MAHFAADKQSVRLGGAVAPPSVRSAKIASSVETEGHATTGTQEVVLHGDPGALATLVSSVGGHTLASVPGAVTAAVPSGSLSTLAASNSVSTITAPVRAHTEGSVSEGVAASGAGAWQTSGNTGSGVKVAIVDGGFTGLSTEVGAGNLPAATVVNGDHCQNVNDSDHGTAVAEIVHQMAPGAQLFLYCVDDDGGFQQSETELQAAGVTIVNSSLGFPGDSRGDGNGAAGSTVATVETARKAGILWIQSAGNNAVDHWSGNMFDTDADTLIDLNGTSSEFDGVFVPGTNNNSGVAGSADLDLQWDQWPVSASTIKLLAFGWQCNDADCTQDLETPINPDAYGDPTPVVAEGGAGQTAAVDIPVTVSTALDQEWDVAVQFVTGGFGESYDLSYWGDVSPNFNSYANPARAAARSISDPATSPYALAVGAVDGSGTNACNSDQAATGTPPLEDFSSQGPTIDGRIKPDISAYDAVSGNIYTRFCGTSAAAPHVAGAAALVKAAAPTMDATQIQTFLEQRASSGAPSNPPTDLEGHGVLTLGATTGATAPGGTGYTALATPVRVLDTRPGFGGSGHGATLGGQGPLPAGSPYSLSVSGAGVPSTATAVAINVTALDPAAAGFVSVFPGGTAWPGTSNVNLSTASSDSTAPVFAIVTLGSGTAINVLAGATSADVLIDVLGYFDPTVAGTKYTPATTITRIVDTRDGTGGTQGIIQSNQVVKYTPPTSLVPAGTKAILVNVTSADAVGPGALCVSPNGSTSTSTVNYVTSLSRANLAVVTLDGSGAFEITAIGAPSDAIVDLIGTFSATGTAKYVSLPAPIRIGDTRTGNGGQLGVLGAGGTQTLYGAGVNGAPSATTALLTGVVAVGPTGSGFFTVYPTGATRPFASNLNFTPSRTVANAVVANLQSNSLSIYNSTTGGNVDVVTDLFGYFLPG